MQNSRGSIPEEKTTRSQLLNDARKLIVLFDGNILGHKDCFPSGMHDQLVSLINKLKDATADTSSIKFDLPKIDAEEYSVVQLSEITEPQLTEIEISDCIKEINIFRKIEESYDAIAGNYTSFGGTGSDRNAVKIQDSIQSIFLELQEKFPNDGESVPSFLLAKLNFVEDCQSKITERINELTEKSKFLFLGHGCMDKVRAIKDAALKVSPAKMLGLYDSKNTDPAVTKLFNALAKHDDKLRELPKKLPILNKLNATDHNPNSAALFTETKKKFNKIVSTPKENTHNQPGSIQKK